MIKEAIAYLYDKWAQNGVVVEEYLGYPYALTEGNVLPLSYPPPKPWIAPDQFTSSTLQGFVEILKANIDGWDLSKSLVACSWNHAKLAGALEGDKKMRPVFAEAHYSGDYFEGWHALQIFRLQVVKCFEENDERQRLLEDTAAFSFKSAIVKEEGTDGLGMSTSDKRDRVAGTKRFVSDPVYILAPYRSFPEAGTQTEIPFLCQIRGGEDEDTTACLTDCGGGAWKVAAAEKVGLYVKGLCEAAGIDVAVVW